MGEERAREEDGWISLRVSTTIVASAGTFTRVLN